MALNDRDITLGGNRGVDVHPGLANPTISNTTQNPLAANFATDPTTDEVGAGAGSDFAGGQDATRTFRDTAGVVEGRPGLIESTNIDPLGPDSNKDDGWANVKQTPSTGVASGPSREPGLATQYASTAATSVTDTAQAAYQAGKEAVFGKSSS